MNPTQLMEQSATTSDRQLVRSLVTLAKQKICAQGELLFD